MAGAIHPLRVSDFRRYLAGFGLSNLARWTELTASLWVTYQLTESPVLLGVMGLARAVPAIVLSPIAGVVADRVDQRRLILVAQVVTGIGSLALGLLVLSGTVAIWQIYLQVAVQAAVRAFDAAGRQSLFPQLVDEKELPDAVTLSVTAGRTSKLIGPVLGGAAIAAFGPASCYLGAAVASGMVCFTVSTVRREPLLGIGATSFREELVDGLRIILRNPTLNSLLKLEVAFSLFQMNEVMITIIALDMLAVGATGLGLLLAAPALGAIVGIALLLTAGHPERQGRVLVLSTVVYAGVMLAIAAAPLVAVVAGGLVLIGLLDAFLTVLRHAMAQSSAPPAARGRVMANMITVTSGIGPLAQTQSGVLTALLGPRLAVATAALALAVSAIGTLRRGTALWQFRTDQPPSVAAADVES